MLAVGDSTNLEIIFSTKKYTRRITKRPKIQTNEGPPDKFVQIIANVVKRPDSTYPVVMRPYKLDLSQFTQKVRDKIEFNITNVSDNKINVSLIAAPSNLMEVDLPSSIDAGATARAVVKLTAAAIDRSFDKSITFELDDEKNSRFTIPVKRSLRKGPGPTASKDTLGK
ncbi:MAG: hypothetical protein ACE5FH_12140 [Candidatus Zixiibacteriota bacterium]